MTVKRIFILFVLLALSTSLHAQRFNKKQIQEGQRGGQWEATVLVQSSQGTSKDFDQGQSLDIDSSIGWGFTVGWNWTEKLNLAYKFTMNKPDYSAVIVPEDPEIPPQTVNYTLTKYAHQFNLTYHFLKGPLTPYIQAGAGWITLDSNIINQPPVTGCWWDPWWGYICTTTWSTYDTTKFSYNAGLGLRWDINAAVFMRGAWNREFVSTDNGNLDFDTLTLEAGLMW
jgi:opacity protein-like surface antigen